MSTKTEIIYTYKSPLEIPPENIHGLQDGSTGKLSIGILDTQDYSYTYISGMSGSYNQRFLPLGEDDTTTIISNVGGGTGNMLLQDEPSSLSIDNVKLNARVKRFENLQIQNANLEVMYEFIPPLIITGATLNCQTQTQTLLTNAQLNLRFKKTIKNLPIILGMEFSFYGTKATAHNSNGGYTTAIIVIHADDGADYPAFRDTILEKNVDDRASNTKGPFHSYQSFVGYRRNPNPGIAVAQCSIVRVKHPFGNPLDTGIAGGTPNENLNNYIMRTQNTSNLRWMIYNGLIDKNLSTQPEGWVNAQTGGNTWNAMVSGNKKLFDHAAFYSTYAQTKIYGWEIPNNNGEGHGGRWLMTNPDSSTSDSQSSFITTVFYTTFENFLNGSYKTFRPTYTNFTTNDTTQSYNEILHIPNSVGFINLGSTQKVATNSAYVSGFQKLQTATNYNFGYQPANPLALPGLRYVADLKQKILTDPDTSAFLPIVMNHNDSMVQAARKLKSIIDSKGDRVFEKNPEHYGLAYFRYGINPFVLPDINSCINAWNDRTQNLCGGILDFSGLNFVGSQGNFNIDSGRTHTFNIQNTLQTFINNNNQELNITAINLNTSTSNVGIYGNVVGSTGTKTLALIDGPSRSTENIALSTIIGNIAASYPPTPISNISVGNESKYNISYSFNNTIRGSTTVPYTNNVLQVGSNLNNGEAINNTNAKVNIKPFIMNCISNAGLTGQLLTLQNWNKLDDSRINLSTNKIANLSSELGGRKLYGDPSTYTIGVSGYFDFSSNNEGEGFTGREYMGFNSLIYGGSTSIYSIKSTSVIGGETYNIDISSFLNSQIDPYSQELHLDSFNVPPFGDTGYYATGIPQLGITAGQFDTNSVILWNSSVVKIQYNYDINNLGQYIEQSLLTDDSNTETLPIDIINDYPVYVQKSYTIPKDITLPLNSSEIVFNIYSSVPETPNIPRLNLGSTAIGKDFIDLDNATLNIDYSYGDSLFSTPFNEILDIGYTLGNFSPSAEKVIPTYLFNKQQRLLTFPSNRFSPLNTLYLVNVRKNQTGYTFNQTPFQWSLYDPLTFKNYQIINYGFNGVKLNSNIDKLISLNDYTIARTGGINVFTGITDSETRPAIDLISRIQLDDICQILDDGTQITSVILDQVNSPNVPYLHRFFKFNYLNTDKELFLLVSSALTGSTAITADIDGLYVEINKTNPNPFITSTDVSSYDLTSQLISFDLTNGLVGGDQFKYDNDYLNPSLYGKGATSYLIDVKYNDQHSLEYFGFTGASTVSILVKGLLPNRLYNKNFLTYNVGLVGSKSKMFNFEFQTGVTGIEFSCKSELTQLPGKILSYNLRLKDLKYVSYPDSTVYQLDTAIPYDLCIDFNDSTVLVNNSPSKNTIITPLTYNENGRYIDISIKGLQRGTPYIGKIYLVSRIDPSYLSNRIYTSTIQIPSRANLALSTEELSSFTYNNTLLKADVYLNDIEKEISSMNSYNGYLYVMGPTGKIYSKQLIESNNNIYGTFIPITRTLPFEIRNLNPGTTFTNLTLRYDNTNIWSPPSMLEGTTSTSNGLIGSTYTNNTILLNIPEFTTPAGPTLGLGITGIPNIEIPQFYNSKLDIANFNFYNNDPSNSYPEIYGGTAIVRRDNDNVIVGYKALSTLSSYPINIEIYLDREKLYLGQVNTLKISYQWTDFNNVTTDSFNNGIVLEYSVVLSANQTSLKTYNYTPLFSKIIPAIDMNRNKVGDMYLKDLKCDLILKASSTGNFVYRGNFDAGVTYSYKNVIVASGNYYALMGTTSIRNIDPIMDRSWVNITPYLPEGYSFNINNIGQNNNPYLNPSARNNFVYRQVFSPTPPIFAGFVYDIVGSTGIDRINYVDFGNRYLKLSYNNGTFDGVFEKLFPNQTYNLEYIRSQITLDNGNTIILDSGSTSMGFTNTLMDYIGSESLTGSTSTFFTLKELNYQGSTSYFTDGQIFLNGNAEINYGGDQYYYFAATGTTSSPSLNSNDWIVCLINGSTANSSTTILPISEQKTYKKGELVSIPLASGELRGFVRDYTTGPNTTMGYPDINIFDTSICIPILFDNQVDSYKSLGGAPNYLDVPSTSYSQGNAVYNTTYSSAKDIVSEGVTFGSTGTQDYLTYQPEISIKQQVFDQSSNSNIFYNTLSANVGITGERFNKVILNITNFGLTGYNLDDYFVVKGGTFGSTGSTSSINYYKEFKLRDYYINPQTFSELVIDKLEETTLYSNFKLHYKYAYMDRLSDTFVNLPSFLTRAGLDVNCNLIPGIKRMYATISNVTINNEQRSDLFGSNNPSNRFIFYLFKFKPDTITGPPVYTPNDETDYSIIKSNQSIPFSVQLPGADQGVIYDRMYFHHTEVIDGTEFTFKRLNEI
uniref:Uncharacterized protein n=1 Tax=viral metagenome TaxID=1070528 RepID=A0A6C0LDF5_9ZZZZ